MNILGSQTIYTIELTGKELRMLYDVLEEKTSDIDLYSSDELVVMKREIMKQFDDLDEILDNYGCFMEDTDLHGYEFKDEAVFIIGDALNSYLGTNVVAATMTDTLKERNKI